MCLFFCLLLTFLPLLVTWVSSFPFTASSFLPVFSGFDSRGGGGRRAFGSSFRRDYEDGRGSNDRFGDRDRYGDREDRFERRDERREERGEFTLMHFFFLLEFVCSLEKKNDYLS